MKFTVSGKSVLGTAAIMMTVAFFAGQHANAEGSFLLQLGTFVTRAEADKKWADASAAHQDVLGKLKGHVAEVMLPPDNSPSYRTQAGPVDTRAEAKALCKTLESRDVQCLVVETAFAAADLSPEMAGEAPSSAAGSMNAFEDTPTASRGASAATQAEAAITTEAMQPLTPAPVVAAVSPRETMTTPAEAKKEVVANEKAEEKPGFFGRLFSSSPASTKVITAGTPEPQKNVLQASRTADKTSFNPNDVKKSGFFRGAFSLKDKPAPAPVITEEAPEKVAVAAENSAEKPGFFGRLFGRSAPSKGETAPAPSDVKGDVEVAEAIRVPVTDATLESPAPAPAAGTTIETVRVEPETAPAATNEAAIKTGGSYWAQISYFDSEDKAHTYYDQFRETNPELFESVRIRITRPFASTDERVSLRMGPFMERKDVKGICVSARANGKRCTTIRDIKGELENYGEQRPKRRASPLETLGIPAVESTPSAPEGSAPEVSGTGIGAKWVSVGGFQTAQQAWDFWRATKTAQPEFANVQSVITGALGGSENAKFQLRLGPLSSSGTANAICNSVARSAKSCVGVEAP